MNLVARKFQDLEHQVLCCIHLHINLLCYEFSFLLCIFPPVFLYQAYADRFQGQEQLNLEVAYFLRRLFCKLLVQFQKYRRVSYYSSRKMYGKNMHMGLDYQLQIDEYLLLVFIKKRFPYPNPAARGERVEGLS